MKNQYLLKFFAVITALAFCSAAFAFHGKKIPLNRLTVCINENSGTNLNQGQYSLNALENTGDAFYAVAEDAGINSIFPADSTIFSNCEDLTNKFITIDIQNNGTVILNNVPVHYQVNGGTIVNEIFPGPLNPGAHFFYNFTAGADFSTVGPYLLMAWTADTADVNHLNDTIVANIQTIQGTVVSMPWSEDFESFTLCDSMNNCGMGVCALSNGFMNDVNGTDDDIDWRTHEGSTATINTGPDFDHNPGTITGHYLYLEASFCFGMTAQLVSPCLDLSSTMHPKLNYWYHMFGNTMGELHTDIYNNGSWTNDVVTPLAGDQGDAWHELSIDLTAYVNNTIKFRIRGITGANTRSDMAIDDFSVTEALSVDAGINSVTPDNGSVFFTCDDPSSQIISVNIFNAGFTPLTNIPVNYQLNNGTVVTETVTGPIAANSALLYNFTTPADFSTPGSYDLQTWVSMPGDTNYINDTLHANIQSMQTLFTIPWSDDFESFDLCNTASNCGLTVCPLKNGFFNEPNGTVDDIDWRTNQGNTPSDSTGPSMDWNPGTPTGHYLYTEASNNCFFQRADLISPCIDLTGASSPELSYKFNMNGNTMGVLHTDIYNNGNWINDVIDSVSGNYGDNWLLATANLTPYIGNIIKIRLRGITGSNYQSDMAVDDMAVHEQTGIQDQQHIFGKILVAPNPGNGLFTVVLNNLPEHKLNLFVMDMQGRMVFTNNCSGESSVFRTKLDLTSLAKGVYTLEAICGSKIYKTKLCIL